MSVSTRARPRPDKPQGPLQTAFLCAAAARRRKASDLALLKVTELSGYTDYLLIASGRSTRQVSAVAQSVERVLKKAGRRPLGREGAGEGRWVLLDYGEVIVHIFHEPARRYYGLDSLWGDAPRVELDPDLLERLLPPDQEAAAAGERP